MMKKICFIVSTPMTAEVFLKNPIYSLSDKYEIHLAANLSDINKAIKIDGVSKIHHLPIKRKISFFSDVSCLFKAYIFFKKSKFHAIHSISPKAGLISMLGGLFACIPMRTHTFTGQVWANKTGIYCTILKLIDKLINNCATHIIVDGKSQREFLIKHKVVNEESLVLGVGSICGVDLERFKPSETTRQSVRDKLGFKQEDWVFMFLGRLNKEKGVVDLINAFAQIKTSLHQKLILVGHDEENIIDNNKGIIKSNNITYLPFSDKPEETIQACDAFCLPSYREGFGLSVIEASALSKPIICSDIYGLKDTIIENKTGIRHQAKNIKDISEKLVFALENKELMKKMGIEGRKYVSKRFSDKIVLEEWINFYENLFKKNIF